MEFSKKSASDGALPSVPNPVVGLAGQNDPVPAEPVRILLVEDDATIRQALALALKDDGYQVSALSDGESAVGAAGGFRPDLAILDIRLPPGPDGLSVARTLRESRNIPIVFLTAADALEDRLAGFHAGGDDYVVKPFSMAELLARVRAVLRRTGALDSGVWQVDDLVVDESARTAVRGGTVVDLTRTEFDLLALLGRQRGRVLSKRQILTELWGYEGYQENVVEAHMSALRRKLEEDGDRLIHTVRGAGYVLRS
jgi:DNA-binding response OmpR family regulator